MLTPFLPIGYEKMELEPANDLATLKTDMEKLFERTIWALLAAAGIAQVTAQNDLKSASWDVPPEFAERIAPLLTPLEEIIA